MRDVKTTKAFYLHCATCGFSEVEFYKVDVERQVKNHDCAKYLKRRLVNGHRELLERFEITVTRRSAGVLRDR